MNGLNCLKKYCTTAPTINYSALPVPNRNLQHNAIQNDYVGFRIRKFIFYCPFLIVAVKRGIDFTNYYSLLDIHIEYKLRGQDIDKDIVIIILTPNCDCDSTDSVFEIGFLYILFKLFFY